MTKRPISIGSWDARRLFASVAERGIDADRLYDTVLSPTEPFWAAFPDCFAQYRRFASAPHVTLERLRSPMDRASEDLWTLYALSRVFEFLVLHRYPLRNSRGALRRPDAPWVELLGFFGVMGMDAMPFSGSTYHPFFHEVVEAEIDPELGDEVLVQELIWPGLWFGDLVFARAGVRVASGPEAPFDPAIATRSTLYFAWTRPGRPVSDLSHGWGSNSQWRTEFRRDYVDGGLLRYNVDGRISLSPEIVPDRAEEGDLGMDDDLTRSEKIERLTHRCFVRTTKDGSDRWPFNDTFAEPAPHFAVP